MREMEMNETILLVLYQYIPRYVSSHTSVGNTPLQLRVCYLLILLHMFLIILLRRYSQFHSHWFKESYNMTKNLKKYKPFCFWMGCLNGNVLVYLCLFLNGYKSHKLFWISSFSTLICLSISMKAIKTGRPAVGTS